MNEATGIFNVHDNVRLMLNAMPFCCHLWNREGKIFDCNRANFEFFKLRNKQELLDDFFSFSPEYQPDGQRSEEKGAACLQKAFDEGKYVFEWMHQASDGTPLPTEITLVRVHYENGDVVASYTRDLREHKRIIREIEERDELLATVNRAAAILLFRSESDAFETDLQRCMGMIAKAGDFNIVSIWQNRVIDGHLGCVRIHGWSDDLADAEKVAGELVYDRDLPGWDETLSRGNCVHNVVRDLPVAARQLLSARGIQSVFAVPVFWQDNFCTGTQCEISPAFAGPVFGQDQFWGMVTYANYESERLFSQTEQTILRSGTMMFFNALLRHTMATRLRAAAAKLEAVVANYAGIIWSVDRNDVITLSKGGYLDKLHKESANIEGRKLDEYFDKEEHADLLANIRKTFTEGARNWVADINGMTYHVRTTPILDASGHVTDVMGCFDDITKLNGLQAELNKALKAAQEANRAKDSFLAKMSHEMRTPLNAVIGLSELLLENPTLPDQGRADIEKISNAGTTLLNLVNDLLDISKIQAGRFELVPIEYDTPSLLNDAITQSILYIGEKPVRFALDIDETLPLRLYGDQQRAKQILNNLLSNAFKYTREGEVELSVRCDRDGDVVWMTLQVRDTGIGIRPEDLGRLFTDYVQLNNQKIGGGTGLGLPIAKRMVEMMGGSITVTSEYQKGSVFTARFPQKFVSDAMIGPEVADNLKAFRYSDHKRRQRALLTRIDLSYARVLVVDDMPTNLDVTKGMMMPYGMRVDCVTSGQQAIDAIRAEKVRYNAVFMDHMMPGMDGIEATRIIRENIKTEYAKTIPIIALTANAIVGNEEMFLRNGFQAFLSKPIDMGRLDVVLREWVRNKELEQDAAAKEAILRHTRREYKERRVTQDRRSGVDRRVFGENIAGLYVSKGIQRFGGDEETFLHVLRSFATNTPPLLDKMAKVSQDTLADYAIAAHGIKGSSRGICADMVGDQAEALEKAAKSGNFNFVYAKNPAFLQATRRLVADIKKMLGKMAERDAKPKKDTPEQETLKKLSIACKNNDMDEVDAAMAELEGYEYELDNGLMAWLRENVEQINLAEIQGKISALP